MTGRRCTDTEATAISGRSKSWLQRHTCALCDQTLWRTLRYGCGSMYEKCDPTKKNFSPAGRSHIHDVRQATSPLTSKEAK